MNGKNIVQIMLIVCAVITAGRYTQISAANQLDEFLTRMDEAKIPGFAACIVKNGKVRYTENKAWEENRVRLFDEAERY